MKVFDYLTFGFFVFLTFALPTVGYRKRFVDTHSSAKTPFFSKFSKCSLVLIVIVMFTVFCPHPHIAAETIKIYATMDANTENWNPGSTYSEGNVGVYYDAEYGDWRYMYLYFPLDELPDEAILDDAEIGLYAWRFDGDFKLQTRAVEIDLFRVEEPWDEDTITWNNAPSRSSLYRGEIWYQGSADKYYYIGQLEQNLIPDLLSDGNYGVMLKLNSTYINWCNFTACGSENSDQNKRPYLQITYHLPGITLLSPVGGETLYVNLDYDIRWNWEGPSSTEVTTTLYKGSQNLGNIMDGFDAADEIFQWRVFSYLETGSDYWVKISSRSDPSVNDSGGYFTILGSEPDIHLNATSHDYGSVLLGNYSDWTLTISNQGNSDLTVHAPFDGLGGTDWAIDRFFAQPFTIQPGNNESFVLRFRPTQTGYRECNLRIQSDDPDEPDLTVRLYGTGGPVESGQLQFSSSTYNINEYTGNIAITVTRTNGSDGAVTVDYATSNGSATAGSDYTATSGTLTFSDGETSETFTVSIIDDSAIEGDETMNLILINPKGGASLGSPNTAVLTIVDTSGVGIPGNLYASKGDYLDKVRLTFTKGTNAHSTMVYRNTIDDSISATLLDGAVIWEYYDDTSAEPGITYYYWVKGAGYSGTSDFSDSVTGWVAVDDEGYMITSNLWIRAVINTEEKGPIDAVWQKAGEDTTSRGDRVIWGHFYASPLDVTWGSENNPDLFVKIWFDVSGRVDVNYFHVSVPDIEVYSDYPYDGMVDEQGTTTMDWRYIRQYYQNGQSYSEENYEDGNPPAGYWPTGDPSGYSTINDLRIGSVINTVEKGPVDAVWRLGGLDTTARGDQVVWGHFYASPDDVTWGSQDNPDLFVKIWFDVSGRVDVNFFHVSVPDIEVYSDLPDDGTYDQKGTTIMENRYIRHEY